MILFHPQFRQEWMQRFQARHAWPDVGHYVMEDAPERVLEIPQALLGLRQFIYERDDLTLPIGRQTCRTYPYQRHWSIRVDKHR